MSAGATSLWCPEILKTLRQAGGPTQEGTTMLLDNPFAMPGNWYRGNLHAHTTVSDGDTTPDELAAHYRESGYDFLFITDHNRVADTEGLSTGEFLVLPGAELSVVGAGGSPAYHVVALGVRDTDGLSGGMDVQSALDIVLNKGGLSVVAHPYWSGLTARDLLGLRDYIGIEVYNTSCDFSIGKGCSAVHWDTLLAAGRAVWGIAADDVHWHFSDTRPVDACGGWVMVKAPALAPEHILHALRSGHFYASTGAHITNIAMDGEDVVVSVPEARRVNFIANGSAGQSVTNCDGTPLTNVRFTPRGNEGCLRVECIGYDGTTAWSNPLWVN